MRRLIYLTLICCLLAFIVFPIPLRAFDTTTTGTPKNPEEMLTGEETVYVALIRGLDIAARGQIADLRGKLAKVEPIDEDWGPSAYGSLTELADIISAFHIGAPASFSDTQSICATLAAPFTNISQFGLDKSELFNTGTNVGKRDLLKWATELQNLSGVLDTTTAMLDKVQSSLNGTISKLAKERAAAYNFYGSLMSCSETT